MVGQHDNEESPFGRRDILKGGAGLAGATTVSSLTTARDAQDNEGLRVGISNRVESFDPESSTGTTPTIAQSLLFEGLTVTDTDGNVYPWLAEEFEQVALNDLGRRDYEQYMTTFEASGGGGDASVDTGDAFEVLRHPDDVVTEEGDEVRVLTFDDAADAVDDGVFGMQYRYRLREGIQFHDGTELTATDVVASYDRLQRSNNQSQYFDLTLYYEAVDESTVDIYAQIVDAAAPRDLPPLVIHPESQAAVPLGELDPRAGTVPTGTGPYELVEGTDGSYWRYERTDEYWVEQLGVETFDWFEGDPSAFPDAPLIDSVRLEVIEEAGTRSLALQNGDIHMTTELDNDDLSIFDASDDYEVAQTESGGYTYIQFPVRAEPWDDPRLRQAVNNLVPRQTIADDVFNGRVRPAFTMLPEPATGTGTTDYEALRDDVREYNAFDSDRAERLIEAVIDDYALDPPIEIQLETNRGNNDRVEMLQRIADSMVQTGYFEANVETHEFSTFVQRILSPEYGSPDGDLDHIACIGLSGTFNPHSYIDAIHHSDNIGRCCNLTGIDNPEIDQLIDDARFNVSAAQDPDIRRDRYDRAFRQLEEFAGVATTHFLTQETVYTTDINGFDQWPFDDGYLDYALYAPQDQQVITFGEAPAASDDTTEESPEDDTRDDIAPDNGDWSGLGIRLPEPFPSTRQAAVGLFAGAAALGGYRLLTGENKADTDEVTPDSNTQSTSESGPPEDDPEEAESESDGEPNSNAASDSGDGFDTQADTSPTDDADGSAAVDENPTASDDQSTSALRDKADQTLVEANTAHSNGDYQVAIDAYQNAIDAYQQLHRQTDDADRQKAIAATVDDIQQTIRETRSQQSERADLREYLHTGDSNFQTAIAAHCRGETTLARTRYRQAKTSYERALDRIENTGADLFTSPLTITPTVDGREPRETIADIPWVDAQTASALADEDIETTDDLQALDTEELDALLERFVEEKVFVQSRKGRLGALQWWAGEIELQYTAPDDVQQRLDQTTKALELL